MNQTPTILVIDDEKDILKSIQDTLESEGFGVVTALDGGGGIAAAKKTLPDLILLDLRLPDLDGFDVCRALKGDALTANIPILMVSTRNGNVDKVVGLEIGADDYITKPYNPLELIARIRVALRRRRTADSAAGRIAFGPIAMDLDARHAMLSGQPLRLTRKEFDLLALFLSKPGRVLTRNALMVSVWGDASDSLHGTIDSHIKTLRQKLRPADRFLVTVPGVGYRWGDPNQTDGEAPADRAR